MAEVAQGEVAPAVVADVVPASTDASNTDTGSETPPGDKPPAPPERTFSQKDLDRIVAKERRRFEREALERATDRVRAEFAEKQLREARGTPATPKPEGRPQAKDYENDPEAYLEALADYKLAEREKAREEKAQAAAKERDERDFNSSRVKAIMKGSEKFDDFKERVFTDDYDLTDAMIASVSETKAPADVVYYLAQHPDEASRIAALPTTLQAHEIHVLASKVAAPPATTKAPAPITPQTGTASVEKRLEDADYDDFVKIRRKQIAAKHGRP